MPPHMIVRLTTPKTYFKGTVSPPQISGDSFVIKIKKNTDGTLVKLQRRKLDSKYSWLVVNILLIMVDNG